MNIQVHIERLVVEGLPLAMTEGPRLRRAVEFELSQLVHSHSLSDPIPAANEERATATIHMPGPLSGGAVGRRIAQTLYDRLYPSPGLQGRPEANGRSGASK
jgi:hypothetical protein